MACLIVSTKPDITLVDVSMSPSPSWAMEMYAASMESTGMECRLANSWNIMDVSTNLIDLVSKLIEKFFLQSRHDHSNFFLDHGMISTMFVSICLDHTVIKTNFRFVLITV